MKLKVVRTYQSIEFGKSLETYFTAAKLNMKNIKMELYKTNMVMIRRDSDCVLVPLTNVAFMIPEIEENKDMDFSRERKLGES